MKLIDSAFEIFPIQMGINFGSGNTFMAQHFLYGTQICTTLNQMRGK
jgi:hypothetical protein